MTSPSPPRLIAATFQARPTRFTVEARLESGRVARAHLADPGRLRELLLPGASLRLRPVPRSPHRASRYTVSLVRSPEGTWVSVETTRANRLAEDLLARGAVRGIGAGWNVRREVRRGRSRFDFQLERDGDEIWAEVKSVTLVVGRTARFPDAPTERGARHLRELREVVEAGGRALVLFVAQRGDARAVGPHRGIDPAFAEAMAAAARAGVVFRAAGYRFAATGAATYMGPLPVRR